MKTVWILILMGSGFAALRSKPKRRQATSPSGPTRTARRDGWFLSDAAVFAWGVAITGLLRQRSHDYQCVGRNSHLVASPVGLPTEVD
jgi:hypothetical protein